MAGKFSLGVSRPNGYNWHVPQGPKRNFYPRLLSRRRMLIC